MHRSPAAAGLRLLPDQLAAGAGSVQWAETAQERGLPLQPQTESSATSLYNNQHDFQHSIHSPKYVSSRATVFKHSAGTSLHASTRNIQVTSLQHLPADWLQWGEPMTSHLQSRGPWLSGAQLASHALRAAAALSAQLLRLLSPHRGLSCPQTSCLQLLMCWTHICSGAVLSSELYCEGQG